MSIISWGQEIALYIVFILIFSVIYLLTWGFTRHHFKNFTIYYQLMLGVFFAVLAAIAQGLIYYFENNINIYVLVIYLPIIICWILGIFASFFAAFSCSAMVFVFSFEMPNVLPEFFLPMSDYWLIGLMVLLHITNLIVCLVGTIKKWTNWTKWSLVSLISLILSSLLVVLINVKTLKIVDQLEYELNILIWIGVAYFSYFLGWTIENIYHHAIKLQNIVVYDNNAFIREALSHSYIYQNINHSKIRHGFYLTYEIKDIDQIENHINSSVKDKIIDLIAMQVIFHFKDSKNIFFKASKNNFGIFIPLNTNQSINLNVFKQNNFLKQRPEDDVLSEIENKLKSIITSFKLRNYQITVNLQAYVSLYGIQSNNLERLKEMNIFLFNNKKQISFENVLLFADEKIIKEIKEKNRHLLALNEILSLDRIASVYYPVIDTDKFEIKVYYATNIIDGSNIDIDYNSKLDLVDKYNISEILIRYNSALNIKNFRHLNTYLQNYVFLNYPSRFISSMDFNAKKFIQKLIEFKIKPSNIILVFDITKDIISKEALEANIGQLKKYDLKISVNNLGLREIKYELLAFYKPDYGIINNKIVQEIIMRFRNQELLKQLVTLSNKLKMQLVAPYVNSYLIYKKLKLLNIPLIFGNLIAHDEKPIKTLSSDILFLLNK